MYFFPQALLLLACFLSFSAPIFGSIIPLSKAPTFKAVFGSSPAPFKIDVDPYFIQLTKLKAFSTRYAVDLDQPDNVDGPSRHDISTVRDYWVESYDWFQVQDDLNNRFTQFTTSVTTGKPSNFTDLVPLHFVHHRSNRTDAIPLIFLHGWPGSFMEVGPIIASLTSPPSASMPAFHVVAPSIPGFAFSPAPLRPGMGPRAVGQAFNQLMLQLEYPKYVIQGGDFGGVILREMAAEFPENVVSVLSNFWVVRPNATDLERFANGQTTADENTTIATVEGFELPLAGYRMAMETRPLQVAIALTDSPLGNAMWMYDLMRNAVDKYLWTPQEIITWSMMYYIPGPYGAARFYKENLAAGVFEGFVLGNNYPFVTQPVAISEFPKDIWYGTPLDWARRYGNVVVRTVHDSGGHFAAVESPALLLQDIWSFWGNASLSNVGVFAGGVD